MQRRTVIAGMAGSLPAMTLVPAADASPAAMNEQVTRLVKAYEAAWNASDMDAMKALYAPDVHWVNIVGMHRQGLDEVDYAHRALFATSFRGVASTLEEIESVVPLPGGGAVAVARWAVAAYRSPSGHDNAASRTRMTLVLIPDNGSLRIAHSANIQIVEPAQRSDPVRQRRERKSD